MKKLLIVAALAALFGCSDAERADLRSQGKPHHIVLYSGGVKLGEWDSTGAVKNEDRSDGFYFEDVVTLKKVEVCGQVVITVK